MITMLSTYMVVKKVLQLYSIEHYAGTIASSDPDGFFPITLVILKRV